MPDLAHAILHVALCTASARGTSETLPLHVQMMYRVGGAALDKTLTARRGSHGDATVEFDVDRGLYRLILTDPAAGCSTTDFLDFLSGHLRTVAETMEPGPPEPSAPVVLFEGSAPQSFLYVKPTFVVFDKTQTCDQPIGTPLNVKIVTEYDPLGFYVWMYSDATLDQSGGTVIAARLRTPTGLYHYLKLPIAFPVPWGGWPPNEHIDFTEDDFDSMATMKTGVLLCPKIYETSSG